MSLSKVVQVVESLNKKYGAGNGHIRANLGVNDTDVIAQFVCQNTEKILFQVLARSSLIIKFQIVFVAILKIGQKTYSDGEGCSAHLPHNDSKLLSVLQGFMQPHLLGNEFTHLEFPRRVQRKEVGKRMLYRDFTMNGWCVFPI